MHFQSTHQTTYSYVEKNHYGLSPHCSCPHLMTSENPEALIVHPVQSQYCGQQCWLFIWDISAILFLYSIDYILLV